MKILTRLFSAVLIVFLVAAPLAPIVHAEDSLVTNPGEASSTPEIITDDIATSTEKSGNEASSTKPLEETPRSFARTQSFVSTPEPITIHLEIDTASETLYDDSITVTACADAPDSDTETVNGYCAVEQSGVSVTWDWFNFGSPSAFINTIEGVGNGNGSENYWTWFHNGEAGVTGLNQHELHDGETLLITIDRMPTRLSVSDTSPHVGSSTVATVEGFNAFDFAYEPLEGASITGAQANSTDGNGETPFMASTTDSFSIYATKDGYLKSNSVQVNPIHSSSLPSIPITLEIDTASTTLFNGGVTVTACPDALTDGAVTLNGYCALTQSGVPVTWNWFDFGSPSAFLDTISGIGNGHGSDNYWTWFADGDAGLTGLNQHVLTPNEHLLVTIDRMPLRVSVSNAAPTVGSTTTVTVEGFNAFNFDYEPIQGASIVGAIASTTDSHGLTTITATSTTPFSITATATSYLTSSSVTISPTTASTTDSGGNSGGGNGGNTTNAFNSAAAFSYLASVQSSDGSFFSSPIISDWAAIALSLPGAPASARAKSKSYLLSSAPRLDVVNDYERRAMALEALGINPYTGTGKDYITPIVNAFDGTQIGDPSEVNDDMFALPVLIAAGYKKTDPIISKTVAFIVAEQSDNGSWIGGVDIAAAGVQTLAPFSSLPGVRNAITKAESYLRSQQKNDGGFGDVFNTPWVIQAIEAAGESDAGWSMNGNTPLGYLVSKQGPDGGIQTEAGGESNKAWATAYALPAANGNTWNSLLDSFARITANNSGASQTSTTTASTTASTTIPVVTDAAPSTLPTLLPALVEATTTAITVPSVMSEKKTLVAKVVRQATTTPISLATSSTNLTASVANAPMSIAFVKAIGHFFGNVFHAIGSFFSRLLP